MPSGLIPVTAPNGVEVSGLTVGHFYTIENTGGPWFASGTTQPNYVFRLSNDGATFYGPMGALNHTIPPWATSAADVDSVHTRVLFQAGTTSIWITVDDAPGFYSDNGGSMGWDLEPFALTLCAYGGQTNPGATLPYAITTGTIDLVVATALALTGQLELIPFVETALAAIEGTIPFAIDCTIVPQNTAVPLNLLDPQTLTPSNLLAWFRIAAWNTFCQCTPAPPGSPDPVGPTPPVVIAPPGATQQPPTIVCDNTDLCTYLNQLRTMLEALVNQVGQLRGDVRLIQRQKVPFAYVRGALHSDLTGASDFAVQGILGLAVQVTTVPGASGEEAGDPTARFGLGWINTGTPDGWRRSIPIRANPQWVDVEPDDTLVGYSLNALVVANIQEFAREP